MAAIISIFVTRVSRLFGLTASAAVTATSAFGAAQPTSRLSTALIQPRPEHHSGVVPGAPRTDTAAIASTAVIPRAVTFTPGSAEIDLVAVLTASALPAPAPVAEAVASLMLPEQRSMPGWIAARAALEAKRNAAGKRNACKPIPVRKKAAPKRHTKRVVWREAR
jgi:hypothetical protein